MSLIFAPLPQFVLENIAYVPLLDGQNFSDWEESILFTLEYRDLAYALCEEEPPAPTDTNAPEVKKKYEWWEKFNCLSLMLMKSRVNKSIQGAIGEVTKAKDFMKTMKEQFAKSYKALASTLMKRLTSKIFDSSRVCVRTLRKHIRRSDISEAFLVHFILNSLPAEYGTFKISYNTRKEE
ncbi:hypothetical protein CRG98_042671 [Punica granatum]|uniref:Retrotransposon Copia-like N-terminal domain-containing protein n=1 Tax=Punica granatum TaxID=22663 RepID=A0A2I0HZQ1_PUNGR|nr:hypothetical protein CRG98_042671 [Punica granatum]